jgi:hypothetical protein
MSGKHTDIVCVVFESLMNLRRIKIMYTNENGLTCSCRYDKNIS